MHCFFSCPSHVFLCTHTAKDIIFPLSDRCLIPLLTVCVVMIALILGPSHHNTIQINSKRTSGSKHSGLKNATKLSCLTMKVIVSRHGRIFMISDLVSVLQKASITNALQVSFIHVDYRFTFICISLKYQRLNWVQFGSFDFAWASLSREACSEQFSLDSLDFSL